MVRRSNSGERVRALVSYGGGRMRAILLCGLAVVAVSAPKPADAQAFYGYIDDRGVHHFTNVAPGDGRYKRKVVTRRGIHASINLKARPPVYHGYDNLIGRAARAYSVEPALVKAVIAAESNFDATAVSRVGAQGLMQLMPRTADAMGVSEPFEPTQNVLGGTRYLRRMLERYGDVSRALAAYNAGPRAVDRYQGIPPYRETQRYVTRVLNYYRRYDEDFRR